MPEREKTAEALETLYGGAQDPVCALDSSMRVFWQSDSRAEPLLAALFAQLGTAGTAAGVPLRAEEPVVMMYADPPTLCQITQSSDPDGRYYILHFEPLPQERPLTAAEARAMLQAQTAAGRSAVISILQGVHKLEELLGAADAAPDPTVLRMVHEACYALLNRDARCSELLWYEAQEQPRGALKPTSVSLCLERFLSELGDASGGLIRRGEVQIAPLLYAEVDPRRLQFVLLALFVRVQGGDPARNVIALQAERKSRRVIITMSAGADADAPAPEGLFRRSAVKDGTLLSEEALVQRFCAMYGAEYQHEAGSAVCTLTLPASEKQDPAPTLHSPLARYGSDRSTLTHVMLSSVLSAAAFFPPAEKPEK